MTIDTPQGGAFVIALVGAESTGKSTLARELHQAFAVKGIPVIRVDEYLREFCDWFGRTPRQNEQPGIAAEQTRRIGTAAAQLGGGGIVIADTTALMIAVYSDQVFGDRSLYEAALADHARVDLTLLTALDLPWLPDGLQRDGPQVREPVDAKVRAALRRGGFAHAIVAGTGPARLAAAWEACEQAHTPTDPSAEGATRWVHHCGRCGDAGCERSLFKL
ncbi:MAG: ATP-binding protein [Burkholderiales bacterium]